MTETAARWSTVAHQEQPETKVRLRFPRLFWLGLVILLLYGIIGLFAPVLAPHDPAAFDGKPLEYPSANHLLGTNDIGQDLLSEIIFGARVSLLVGITASAVSVVIATLLATIAAYMGGWIDAALMRVTDLLIIIPRLPLMILLAAYAGASLATTILVIGLLGWPQLARVVRAQVLSLRRRPHVNAARLFGASAPYVIRRHLIPALLPILAAGFVTHAGHAAMMEAGLAFLGLGDPTMKSWGLTIRYALNVKGFFFGDQWLWWILPAGFNLAMLLMAFAFVGIGLEAVANPRIRRHR